MPQSFTWIEYTGYVVVYTEAGGVGIAKYADFSAEFFLPDTAIKLICYDEHGDSPHIILRKRFTALRVESSIARRKGLC